MNNITKNNKFIKSVDNTQNIHNNDNKANIEEDEYNNYIKNLMSNEKEINKSTTYCELYNELTKIKPIAILQFKNK